MGKYLVLLALLLAAPFLSSLVQIQPVKAEASPPEVLNIPQPIKTLSEFESKLETQTTKIERSIKYIDDPETEVGEEKVLEEGSDGTLTRVIKITFLRGKEWDREILSTDKQPPTQKVISRGTKIVWRTIQTPDGEIKYWRKMRVWATHYDKTCRGCDEWTAIGMRQGKGVIAVDPKVIKLRSQVYVPGYGKAVAGDTGGAIKGNIIDLGYEDARTSGWSARFVDIYLLN